MKWNDIREKIKKPIDSMNNRTEKPTAVSSDTTKPARTHNVSDRVTLIIISVISVLVIILIIWLLQSRKVANVGPATDAGLTREEARAAESFLEQIPLKPLTPDQKKLIQSGTEELEVNNSSITTQKASGKSN